MYEPGIGYTAQCELCGRWMPHDDLIMEDEGISCFDRDDCEEAQDGVSVDDIGTTQHGLG